MTFPTRPRVSYPPASPPTDRDLGRNVDLIINDLRLPEKMKEFDLQQGQLHITGTYNENLMPVLYKYPQMATEDFATSVVSPQTRADIVKQFKIQLAGKSELEAVNALLRFTQSAFRYATDDAFHGFEKPYFFEEMLHYAKCDCEDRSIFYTYLLWNVLGVENHLIAYPGHESASVCLSEPIGGDNYTHNSRQLLHLRPDLHRRPHRPLHAQLPQDGSQNRQRIQEITSSVRHKSGKSRRFTYKIARFSTF